MHAGVWRHLAVPACGAGLWERGRVQRGLWDKPQGLEPAGQSKPLLPQALGRASQQPGCGEGCSALLAAPVPRPPVSRAINQRSPKAVAGRAVPTPGAALWCSVAEDSSWQLVGECVPALDLLVLVLQAVEPMLQPLALGIDAQHHTTYEII